MEITTKSVYRTIIWTVEHNDEEYYVRLVEDDIVDRWFVEGDESDVKEGSELWNELVEICCDEMNGRVENKEQG